MQEDLRGAESQYAGLPGFESQHRDFMHAALAYRSGISLPSCRAGFDSRRPLQQQSHPVAAQQTARVAVFSLPAYERAVVKEINELVAVANGKPVTTSRLMAKHFKKRHDNVMRLFRSRIEGRHSAQFIALNFEVVEYIDAKGERREELMMTKNGFIAMATKMHGAEAWQEQFIAAFDAMTEQLERLAFTLWNRRLALETRDATSFAKASIGSRLMLDRKKDLPAIKMERKSLTEHMQPSLPLH